jgi:DNA modification methylase
MGIKDQKITEQYAVYLGDCIEVMADLPSNSVHFSIYSPPFCGLYQYSSNERDLSNCDSRESFFEHYRFVVKEIFRLTKKGRCTAVHCMDIPSGNTGCDHMTDFPGDIIRLHEEEGFHYVTRHCIWKEPLTVRNRTMQKNLAHKTLVQDSVYCGVAIPDYLLVFRKRGDNEIPIKHPTGLSVYYGETSIPRELLRWKDFQGSQIKNRYSHWIWRRYASSFWDDVRLDNVLPFKRSREEDDEKHVHPLQLDVIHRAIVLRTNPGEVVLTPFMGVGSEVYVAVKEGRKAVGIELKTSYYKQTLRNLEALKYAHVTHRKGLL